MKNFDEILKDPADNFKVPADVLKENDLSRDQKVEVLRRWHDDARLLQTAQSEGMNQGNSSDDLITQIQDALEKLDAEVGDT